MDKIIEDILRLLRNYSDKILLETIPIYNRVLKATKEKLSLEELGSTLRSDTYSSIVYEERDGKILGEPRIIITLEYDGYYKEATAYKRGVNCKSRCNPL